MKKPKVVSVVIGVIALSIIILIVVPALIPTWKLGEVAKVIDVPDVGKYISDFRSIGKVRYVNMTQHIRPFGTNVMIVGKSTSDDFKKFFADPDTERIYLKSETSMESCFPKTWSSFTKRLYLKFNEIPGTSPEDICGYKSIKKNGRLLMIKGACRESTNEFVLTIESILD